MTRPTTAHADARLYAAIMAAEDTIDPHAAPVTEPKPITPPGKLSPRNRILRIADHVASAAEEPNADRRADKLRVVVLLATMLLREMEGR